MGIQEELVEIVRLGSDLASEDAPNEALKFVLQHHATIQQNAEDAAKYRNDGSTHAEGCYAWGPKHYECALRKLRDDAEAAKRLRALEMAMGEVQGEGWAPIQAWITKRADEIMRDWS